MNSTAEGTFAEVEARLSENLAAPVPDTPAFVDGCLQQLRSVPISVAAGRRAHILIEAACQYYIDGRHLSKAVEPLAMAVILAEQCGDKPVLRRALSVHGLVTGELLNLTDALRSLMRSLEIAEELGEPLHLAGTWLNFGLALYNSNVLSDARVAFERATELHGRLPASRRGALGETKSLHGAAMCNLRLGDFGPALEQLRVARKRLSNPTSREEVQARCLLEGGLVRALLGTNRIEEALASADIALDMAERSGSIRAAKEANAAKALADAYAGRSDEALERIERIVEMCKGNQDGTVEVLEVAVLTMQRLDRHERAMELHRELRAVIERTRRVQFIAPHSERSASGNVGALRLEMNVKEVVRETQLALGPLRERLRRCLLRPAPTTARDLGTKFRPAGWVAAWVG